MKLISILSLSLLFAGSYTIGAQGTQTLHFGNVSRQTEVPEMQKTGYVLSGKKMYEVGWLDGTYPSGDALHWERGIWAHPVKLLNAISYTIVRKNAEWKLENARNFNYHFHSADFLYRKGGLEVKRCDFVAENECAMYSTLTFKNLTKEEEKLRLAFRADVDIRPSFRTVRMKDTEDRTGYEKDLFFAEDQNAMFIIGADHNASKQVLEGKTAVMDYEISVQPGKEQSITFLIVADNCKSSGSRSLLTEKFHSLIAQRNEEYVHKKEGYLISVLNGCRFSCSDEDLSDAFQCAKANVLLNIKDNTPYYKRPFIGAGIPVYPRLFGTDFSFSTPGLLASGNTSIVRSTLENALDYTKEHWRGPHEVSAEGILMGWDHIQISAQMVVDCWEYYNWTHDLDFLKEVWPLCTHLIDRVCSEADSDGDGFLEGHGLMEESEFQGNWEELSTASYLYLAYVRLSDMAHVLGDSTSSESWKLKSQDFKKSFNATWWNEEKQIWACAIDPEGEQKMYNFWSVIFPLKTGLADEGHTTASLQNIRKHWVNDSWGMVGRYTPERDQSQDGVGLVHNNICATSAFQNSLPDLGLHLLRMTSKGVFHLPHSLLGLFPECQPQLSTNISQMWSYAPYMEAVVQGLMGVRPEAPGHLVISPSFPEGIDHARLDDLSVGSEHLTLSWKRKANGKIMLEMSYTGHLEDLDVRIPEGNQVKVKMLRKRN